VPYFQDVKQDGVTTENITNYVPLTIQPGDMLRLHVTSLNNEADNAFNYNLQPPNLVNNTPDVNINGTENREERVSIVGYPVDHEGNMHLPVVGFVKVAGMTVDSATKVVETKLQQVLSQPVVTLRILNLKVIVMGDVARPSTYTFQDEKLTLNEALSYAGDLNPTGVRNNILLIREVDGKRKYIPMDLTKKDIFTSPYYYLRTNDIIYVTPNRQKVSSSDTAIQRIAVIISAISVAIFLLRSK